MRDHFAENDPRHMKPASYFVEGGEKTAVGPLNGAQLLDPGIAGAVPVGGPVLAQVPALAPPVARVDTPSPDELINRLSNALVPDKAVYASYPTTGVMSPQPAGRTLIDLVAMKILAPNGESVFQSTIDYNEVRSLFMVVDAPISVTLFPTAQRFPMNPGILFSNATGIERVIMDADVPFLMVAFIGTPRADSGALLQGFWSVRNHTGTLTKTAAAGVADDLAAVLWVPRQFSNISGVVTLDQALYGAVNLATAGFTNKMFICRNQGASPIDVQVVGGIFPDLATVAGFLPDPDTGAGGGAPVTIQPGESQLFRTATAFHAMQLEARVSASAGAGATSTLSAEFNATVPAGSGR